MSGKVWILQEIDHKRWKDYYPHMRMSFDECFSAFMRMYHNKNTNLWYLFDNYRIFNMTNGIAIGGDLLEAYVILHLREDVFAYAEPDEDSRFWIVEFQDVPGYYQNGRWTALTPPASPRVSLARGLQYIKHFQKMKFRDNFVLRVRSTVDPDQVLLGDLC